MNRHRLAEERSLALHRAIAARLAADSGVLERARGRVRLWLEAGEVAAYYAREWEAVLSRPVAEICAFLTDESEHARSLRQVTPFAGVIDPRTRWRIWREVREDLDGPG
ncbi:MAG: hypothetical protein ACRD21_23595 [Vicinamibacteria bacterium]